MGAGHGSGATDKLGKVVQERLASHTSWEEAEEGGPQEVATDADITFSSMLWSYHLFLFFIVFFQQCVGLRLSWLLFCVEWGV